MTKIRKRFSSKLLILLV